MTAGTCVVAVVVTYHPDVARTGRLLAALAAQVDRCVVVDNGTEGQNAQALRATCDEVGAELVPLGRNAGIAEAQNVGIGRARGCGATHVLLSDQDSDPAPDMVERLLAGAARAAARGERVGAVGPMVAEDRGDGDVMVYEARTWGPRRTRGLPDEDGLLPVAFLLASGTLIPVEALDEVGAMRSEWFIDHVDLEWGLRARAAGRTLHAVADAHLAHQLGDAVVRLPGRRQEIHVHPPVRVYYLTRNTLLLVRSRLMGWRWDVGYVVWLGKYVAFNTLLVPGRRARLRLALRGLADGLHGRTGPVAP